MQEVEEEELLWAFVDIVIFISFVLYEYVIIILNHIILLIIMYTYA